MAEHAAHITSGGGQDPDRPTIFEVLAQHSLMNTIRPAIRHAVRVFAEKYPEQLGRVLQFYDEIYLIFDTAVQAYFLKKCGGSFAENFYDLKRVPSFNTDQPQLSSKLRFQITVCLVLVPYIRQKLDSLFEDLQYKYGKDLGFWSFTQSDLPLASRLQRAYLSLYPFLHSAWESLSLTYTMTYMLRGGRWHSPIMHLSGSRLVRLSPEDFEELGKHSVWTDLSAWSQLGLRSKLLTAIRIVLRLVGGFVTTGLSVGVFFLQFLEWWYASDARVPSLTALPVPPAPKEHRLEGVQPNLCPLCMRTRTNSTALSVSGYVFCYPCISTHVRKEKCCPVTGYPATDEHLVKIYEQDLI